MLENIITQIGSLPFNNVKKAIDYSLEHDIPFLPELPRKGDSMLDYIQNPGKLSCLDAFKKATKGYDLVKIQCVGPATLIQTGYDENDAVSRSYEHIYAILDGLDAKEVILYLDEPALGNAGFDFLSLWDPIYSSFDVTKGVHTCGNMDWTRLFKSDIDIISFDGSKYDLTLFPGYRNDKRISWGISEANDIKDFKEGDLLTLPCGMSHKLYSDEDADEKLEFLIEMKSKKK